LNDEKMMQRYSAIDDAVEHAVYRAKLSKQMLRKIKKDEDEKRWRAREDTKTKTETSGDGGWRREESKMESMDNSCLSNPRRARARKKYPKQRKSKGA
jgi:hypothetical protein